MGNNDFAPYRKLRQAFRVKNVSEPKKVIRIFNYPINHLQERDLLDIPGVGEADLRASLLKGELLHKILAHEITITFSDIDLIQFNADQKAFLQSAGVINGLNAVTGGFDVQDANLIGVQNSVNTTFTTSTIFKHTADFKEVVFTNGLRNHIPEDYFVAESGGAGTGYDTIIFAEPPDSNDLITIDYFKVI